MSEVVEPQAGNAADRESRERPHVLWKAEIQKNFEHFIHHGEYTEMHGEPVELRISDCPDRETVH